MQQTASSSFEPQEEKYLYTEGIDYAQTGNVSIWGTEDPLTQDVLLNSDIHGRWLNLCAGDGRFNTALLQHVQTVVATDVDPSALQKLQRLTPDALKPKLEIVTCNVVEPLPFQAAEFDGIFCTGTLHLFPKTIFQNILGELDRILKSGGRMIIDFATDIRRVRPDGSLYTVHGEPLYALDEALDFLKECLSAYAASFQTDTVAPEAVQVRGETYLFSCNYILIQAQKGSCVVE